MSDPHLHHGPLMPKVTMAEAQEFLASFGPAQVTRPDPYVYVIGSLRNPYIPIWAQNIREELKVEVFDDWHSAGPEADDMWKLYETGRGRSFLEALDGHAAKHVFDFDLHHLTKATHVVLVLPAGKSGHLELGWAAGKGKKTFVVLDDPDRWDVMYQFVDHVVPDTDELIRVMGLGL